MVEPTPRAPVGAASAPAPPPMSDEVWSRYRSNTARHVMGVARDFENRMLGRLSANDGYANLRPSFGPVLSLVAQRARPLRALSEAHAKCAPDRGMGYH